MKRLLSLLLLLGLPTYATTPTLVQHLASSSEESNTGAPPRNNFQFWLPNAVQSGNCLVLGISYVWAASVTVTITDNLGNSWPARSVTATDGANVISDIYVLPNALPGLMRIQISFSATTETTFQYTISEFANVASSSPVNGTAGKNEGVGTTTANAVTAGSFTPGNNDANGGNLIWAYHSISDVPFNTQPTAMTAGTNFALLDVVNIPQLENAAQYWVQTASAAVNPTLSLTAGGTSNWNSVAVALKASAAAQGNAPNGMRIVHLTHISGTTEPTPSWVVQFPSSGNTIVVTGMPVSDMPFTAISDNSGNTYVNRTQISDSPIFWVASSAATSPTLTLTITTTAAPAGETMLLFDVAGADPNPYDGAASTAAANDVAGADISDGPVLTPASNGLTIAAIALGTGPARSLLSPAGGVFDFISFNGETDGDIIDHGDGRAHYFNSSDLNTQHWNWHIDNSPDFPGCGGPGPGCDTSYSTGAIHLKGAAVGVAHLPQESVLLALPTFPPPAITLGNARLGMASALVPFSVLDSAVTFDVAADWIGPRSVLVCQGVSNAPLDILIQEQRDGAATLRASRPSSTNYTATAQCIGGNPQ